MSAKSLLRPQGSEAGPVNKTNVPSFRMVWACLPAMLALSVVALLVFGVSWWTVLIVVLLLCCPASMAVAIYLGWRPLPKYEDRV